MSPDLHRETLGHPQLQVPVIAHTILLWRSPAVMRRTRPNVAMRADTSPSEDPCRIPSTLGTERIVRYDAGESTSLRTAWC